MSNPNQNLDQRALFWAKLRQRGDQLALARAALLEGRLPAARRLFLECHELELAAQSLATTLNIGVPPALVGSTLSQATQEAYTSIVQGGLISAADLRMRFEGMSEIEQSIPGDMPAKARALLPQVLIEKGRQALREKQFERADEYIEQLIALDSNGAETEMLRADTLLARARHLRTNDGNTEEAQILLDRARIAKDSIPAGSGVSNWRSVFERELKEEQTALAFAAGEQAQRQWQFARALEQYRRVPSDSAYSQQASERITAIKQRSTQLWVAGGLALLLIVGFFAVRQFRTTPPVITATASPQAATIASQPTPPPAPTPSAPTALPTLPPTATLMPTVEPVVQQLRVKTDQLVVYRNPIRKRGEEVGRLRINIIVFKCDYSGDAGSYQIAEKSCDTPLGWVNQNYIDIITSTPTP